jgi:glycosyltransferase involved in cell wall biosynthesis
MNLIIDARALLGSGGVPKYTKELIKNIPAENRCVYLFCNSLKKLENFQSRFPKVFFRIPSKLFNFSLMLFGWPKIDKMAERRLGKKADLFFLPNINFWRDNGAKKIIVAHDLSFAIYPPYFGWRDRIWHRAICPGRLYLEADKVIAVSENTKNDLMNIYGVPAERIAVVYPGVSVDAGELGNRRGNYILYLANLEPRKNILGLIDAYEKMTTDSELWIAGVGRYQAVISHRIAKSDKKNKIKLVGFVKESEKAKLIYESRVFVYPSFYEGFGFPPLEAQILGVPVVASLTSSMSEVLGDSAVLVNPYDTAEIACATEILLTDGDFRNQLIERGWENVKRFSWQKCATEIGGMMDAF